MEIKLCIVLLVLTMVWTIMDFFVLAKIHKEKFLDVEKGVENVEKN